MRFLLHPPSRRLTASSLQRTSKKKGATNTSKPLIVNVMRKQNDVSATSTYNDMGNHIKTWGQQCAPHCGCVLRFESKIDESNNIVEASYQAKAVVARLNDNGRLEPAYTSRNSKPMLKECSCETIHHLAREVTQFLPGQSVERVRSMGDFSTPRSSPAFRHSVLAENGLPRTDTLCFDLLEEAFTAMIKGHMVKPRRVSETYNKSLTRALAREIPGDDPFDQGAAMTRHINAKYGSDKAKFSLSSPRSISALRMLDINAEAWEYEQYINQTNASGHTHKAPLSNDWLSFVDEQYRQDESA